MQAVGHSASQQHQSYVGGELDMSYTTQVYTAAGCECCRTHISVSIHCSTTSLYELLGASAYFIKASKELLTNPLILDYTSNTKLSLRFDYYYDDRTNDT